MFFFIQRSIDDLLFPFYKDQLEDYQIVSWYGVKLGYLPECDAKEYTLKDAKRVCALLNRVHSATRFYKVQKIY